MTAINTAKPPKKHWAAFTADFTYVDIKWTNIQANNEVLSVDEILNYNFNIIKLLGDAGTGKTTALRRMEYLLAKQPAGGQEKPLPVFISLANLRNGKSIILSEAANVLNISRWDAQELISHKEVILLLDGYNEILNDETKRKVASELDSLAAQNDGLKIIMTDRNYTTRNVMRNDVPTLRMARMFYLFSLSLEDKKKFFEANMKDPEKLQIIMKEFSESPETFAMMNKPLTLKHLIDVVEKTGEIPFDLTGGYVDMLYEREMEEKKDPNVAYLRYYLEAFAHLNKDRFSYDDAMEQIALVNRIKAFTKPDSQSCIDLAVGMGILQRENDDQLAFSSEEYRVYFTNCCRDSGLGNRIDELLG